MPQMCTFSSITHSWDLGVSNLVHRLPNESFYIQSQNVLIIEYLIFPSFVCFYPRHLHHLVANTFPCCCIDVHLLFRLICTYFPCLNYSNLFGECIMCQNSLCLAGPYADSMLRIYVATTTFEKSLNLIVLPSSP